MKLSSGPKQKSSMDNPRGGQEADKENSNTDLSNTSANKLRTLLERRKLPMNKSEGDVQLQNDSSVLSMEDMATLLHENDAFTKHLEEQIMFYQDSVAGLRLRTEQVVSENEMLHERLKENSLQDGLVRNNSKVKFGQSEDRKYLYQLENELDEIKRLNQDKTNHLEAIIKSTRKELDSYKQQVSKLQSQLRRMDNEIDQKHAHDNICMKCGAVSHFSSQPSVAQITTVEKLTREKDELTETLTKHKSLLAEYQQREFQAYMEVKKSAETAENAKLEKAEAIIKIKQLESSFEEERKRHESLVSNTNEKWKRECDDGKEKFEKEKQTFQAKIQGLAQKCDENEHHLDKLTREKVNLISEMEKLKARLAASDVEVEKIKQDTKGEVSSITRERVKDKQELENMKNIQARQLKEHEQVKVSLTTENEGLRRRLAEAQSGWLETREENLRTEERLKQFENELHLLTLSKNNLESAHEENREFFKKQEEQREQRFLERVQQTEQKHATLRQELEEMLQAQMKMSAALKDENKRLILKLEKKKESLRVERTKWRDQRGQLTSELEMSRKQHNEMTSAKDSLSRTNDELADKVTFLKRENKKARNMIYNLLKKQKDLMLDRQSLSRELASLPRNQFAGTPYQRYHGPQVAGNISANEQGSGDDTSCNAKPSNVEVNNESESL